MDPIFKLGPVGNLRDLFCPERNVEVSVTRYGGVHQNLSGARVMDITGFRQDITMKWDDLPDEDWRWLNALHQRQPSPGPFRLLNPLSKNRLTPDSSMCKIAAGTRRGLLPSAGVMLPSPDHPLALEGEYQMLSSRWTNRLANIPARWDQSMNTTVFQGETITGSLYIKSTAAFGVTFGFDWFDFSGTQMSTVSNILPSTVANDWTHFTFSPVVPAGAVTCRMYIYTSNTANDIYVAGAQIESGDTFTGWEMGGGAPVVLIDQFDDTSEMFGLHSVTLKLLEV